MRRERMGARRVRRRTREEREESECREREESVAEEERAGAAMALAHHCADRVGCCVIARDAARIGARVARSILSVAAGMEGWMLVY